MTPIIAIIGGGMSGTFTVFNYIKQCQKPTSILWFDFSAKFCKGYAYSSFDNNHLLNVRASNMSAFADEPHHFTNWLKQHDSIYSEHDFVPRKIYGDYVQDTFDKLKTTNPFVTIHQFAEEIISINKNENGFELMGSKKYEAQKILLAFGNFLPAHPSSLSKEFITSKNYFQNAFHAQLIQKFSSAKSIAILGSGLTMIDLCVTLYHHHYRGNIQIISPHAYIPQTQTKFLGKVYPSFIDAKKQYSLLEIFSKVNQQLKIAKKENKNLNSVIDSLRPSLQTLWLQFSLKDKRQFLRHLRHKWGVARHRAPIESMAIFNKLAANNQIQLIKGRISNIETFDSNFEIHYSNLEIKQNVLKSDLIINCTGPESDYTKLTSTLVKQLINSKLIEADELKYGIKAQENGQISPDLFTIGPPLKGILWESTAVPEIREQAKELAHKINCN